MLRTLDGFPWDENAKSKHKYAPSYEVEAIMNLIVFLIHDILERFSTEEEAVIVHGMNMKQVVKEIMREVIQYTDGMELFDRNEQACMKIIAHATSPANVSHTWMPLTPPNNLVTLTPPIDPRKASPNIRQPRPKVPEFGEMLEELIRPASRSSSGPAPRAQPQLPSSSGGYGSVQEILDEAERMEAEEAAAVTPVTSSPFPPNVPRIDQVLALPIIQSSDIGMIPIEEVVTLIEYLKAEKGNGGGKGNESPFGKAGGNEMSGMHGPSKGFNPIQMEAVKVYTGTPKDANYSTGEDYLEEVSKIFNFYEMNTSRKISAFALRLQGAAKAWFDRLKPSQLLDWFDFQNNFLQFARSSTSRETQYQEFNDMKQLDGEDVKTFHSRLTEAQARVERVAVFNAPPIIARRLHTLKTLASELHQRYPLANEVTKPYIYKQLKRVELCESRVLKDIHERITDDALRHHWRANMRKSVSSALQRDDPHNELTDAELMDLAQRSEKWSDSMNEETQQQISSVRSNRRERNQNYRANMNSPNSSNSSESPYQLPESENPRQPTTSLIIQ